MDTKRLSTTLAIAALGLGSILALTDVGGRAKDGAADPGWSAAIEQEADHISARDLSDKLMAQDGETVLVDVRPKSEFDGWHLPGAVNLDVPQLLGDAGQALLDSAGDKLVVLYSNGMVHPAQAWVELARRGHSNVRVLEGGLTDFKHEVLTPPSLRGPISQARAAAELPRFEAARAYFLGPASGRAAAPKTAASAR